MKSQKIHNWTTERRIKSAKTWDCLFTPQMLINRLKAAPSGSRLGFFDGVVAYPDQSVALEDVVVEFDPKVPGHVLLRITEPGKVIKDIGPRKVTLEAAPSETSDPIGRFLSMEFIAKYVFLSREGSMSDYDRLMIRVTPTQATRDAVLSYRRVMNLLNPSMVSALPDVRHSLLLMEAAALQIRRMHDACERGDVGAIFENAPLIPWDAGK